MINKDLENFISSIDFSQFSEFNQNHLIILNEIIELNKTHFCNENYRETNIEEHTDRFVIETEKLFYDRVNLTNIGEAKPSIDIVIYAAVNDIKVWFNDETKK